MVPTTIGNNQQTNDGAASAGRGAHKTLTIKASFGTDLRRLTTRCSEPWAELRTQLETTFVPDAPQSNPSSWRITWVDEDGDHITVQTEADWQECVRHVHGSTSAAMQHRAVIRLHIAAQAAGAGAAVPFAAPAAAPAPAALPSTLPPAPMSPGWQQYAAEKGSEFASHELAEVETLEMMAEAMQAMEAMETAEKAAMVAGSADLVAATEPTPAVAPPTTCHLTMLVDRSGSMRSLGDAVLEGIKTYLQELAAADESGNISTTVLFSTFDNAYEVKHAGISVADAQHAITQSDIEPRGMTALHDAIGQGLSDTEQAVAAMPSKPDKVVVFILTDGEENASRKWTARSVKKQIAKLEAENFEFFFAAAGQDALDTGARMGLSAGDCITWSGDRGSASATFSACAGAAVRSRGGGSKAFTSSERQSTMTPVYDAAAAATPAVPPPVALAASTCKTSPTARSAQKAAPGAGARFNTPDLVIEEAATGVAAEAVEAAGAVEAIARAFGDPAFNSLFAGFR